VFPGRLPCQLGRGLVQFDYAVPGVMELESGRIDTKAVDQNDVGARFEEGAVQPQHLLGFSHTPQIGRVIRFETAAKKVRARGAVCDASAFRGDEVSDGIPHGLASLSVPFCAGRLS